MRKIGLILGCLILTATAVFAADIKPAKLDWTDQKYTAVKSIKKVPVRVVTSLLLKMPNDRRIADRQDKYNVSGRADSKLPLRRFVLGGISYDHVIIAYERSSRPFQHFLAVFSIKNKKPLLIFMGKSPYSLSSIKEIKRLVKNGTIKNQIKSKKIEW